MRVFHNTEVGEVATLMNVSERSVYRFAERFLATGDVRPFLKRNGPTTILGEYEQYYLVCQVLANPGTYLRELQEGLYSATGHWVDLSTILRTLHRANISRQVIKHHGIQRSESRRAEYWSEFKYFGPSMIVWIDESGFDGRNAMGLEVCLLVTLT
jgi:transposase